MGYARAAVLAAAVLAAGVLGACGTRIAAFYEKVVGSPGYARVTKEFTRTREVRDGIETRFILSATWLSSEWARAFAEEYARIYYLDAERRERVVSRRTRECADHVCFFVALFTPDERGNDLDAPGTLWSLRLVDADEREHRPLWVRRTDLRPEEVSRFFPYAGTWYRGYEAAFPREAGAATPRPGLPRLKLVLAGVQGRAVLAWP